jgi:hypothetical protein
MAWSHLSFLSVVPGYRKITMVCDFADSFSVKYLSSLTMHPGLTLQQEAVNTGRNSSVWNTDQRLRDTKVSFISAGNLDNKESTDEADEADKADEADGSDSNNTALAEMSLRSKPQARNEEGDHDLAATIANTPSVDMNVTESFVIDTLGSKPVATGLPPPQLRAVSPTPSNSSEEIILFRGKGRPPRVAPEKSRDDKREKVKVSGIDNQMRVIDDEIHQREELLEHVQHQSSSFRTPVSNAEANGVDNQMRIIDDEIQQREELLEHVEDQSSTSRTPSRNARQSSPEAIIVVEEEVPLQDHFERGSHRNTSQLSRKRNRLSKREREEDRRRRKEREDDAMIADYVANMAQEEPEDETFDQNPFVDQFRVRELGWGEAQGTRDTTEQSLFEHITDTQGESGWNTEDIQDFNGISTSDGEVEETDRILSKRERKCGVQYLVIYSGQIIDDARWVKSAKLSSSNQLRMIAEFEAEEKLLEDVIREHERMAESSNSSDEDLDDDMEDDSDDGDHEELLLQKAMEQMSDEQMARLLAKQEELGMGSNELLLFDAEMDEDEEDDMYFETSAFSRSAKRGPVMMGSKKPGAKRPRGEFPPATALADAYDGFDVMDFERPSLKKKPKGRKGKLPIDISDSELEASMEIAYENDRVKKRERKQEREELRAQGLLGGKNGKVDLKSKYKEGMGIEAVKGAIKIFLMNGRDTT